MKIIKSNLINIYNFNILLIENLYIYIIKLKKIYTNSNDITKLFKLKKSPEIIIILLYL